MTKQLTEQQDLITKVPRNDMVKQTHASYLPQCHCGDDNMKVNGSRKSVTGRPGSPAGGDGARTSSFQSPTTSAIIRDPATASQPRIDIDQAQHFS